MVAQVVTRAGGARAEVTINARLVETISPAPSQMMPVEQSSQQSTVHTICASVYCRADSMLRTGGGSSNCERSSAC